MGKHVASFDTRPWRLDLVYLAISIEGNADLLDYLMRNRKRKGLTAQRELEILRTASFFNHSRIVSIMLNDVEFNFCSKRRDRYHEAIRGAATSGRLKNLQQLFVEYGNMLPKTETELKDAMSVELAAASIRGYLTGAHSKVSVISFILQKWHCINEDVLHSCRAALDSLRYHEDEPCCILKFIALYQQLSEDGHINKMHNQACTKASIELKLRMSAEFRMMGCRIISLKRLWLG